MRTTNTTDIPTDMLREVIRFVCPPGVTGFDVRLNNTKGVYSGRAYTQGSSYHDRACWFIVVHVGPRERFPRKGGEVCPRGGYLPAPWLGDRTEALVYVVAHELRHLWQGRIPRGRRVWGARGQYSERDADAYAIRMLRAWRRRPIGD